MSVISIHSIIFLKKDGSRFFAKYYKTPEDSKFFTTDGQKDFEDQVFSHFNECFSDLSENSADAEIFHIDDFTVLVRNYKDFLVFLVANEEENELIMNEVLTCLHECYLKIITGNSITLNSLSDEKVFPTFLSILDELVDAGSIITLEPNEVLSTATMSEIYGDDKKVVPQEEKRGSSFAMAFMSAKNHLAKTLNYPS